MANVRIVVLFLVLLIIANCGLVHTRNLENSLHREKRLFIGCAKLRSSCTGTFSKSCCHGAVCNTTTGKCVRKGSPTSWLADRNGK